MKEGSGASTRFKVGTNLWKNGAEGNGHQFKQPTERTENEGNGIVRHSLKCGTHCGLTLI